MDRSWFHTICILVIVVGLAGIVWLVVVAGPLLEALVIAALLAYLLNPAVQLLTQRTRLNRSLAAGAVYVVFLLILACIPAGLGALTLRQFHRLEQELREAITALKDWLTQPIVLLGFRINPQIVVDNLEQAGGDLVATLTEGSLNVLSGVTTNILWGMVILVSLFYLLKDGPRIKPWLVGLAPSKYRGEIRHLLDEIDAVWALFLRVQLLIFFILAVLMVLGTLLVIWLFRSGLLPFSPIAFVLLLILVYTLVQQVDNLWLRPQFLGRKLHLHPGLVFVGLIAALALSGFLGALIVVPAMATVKVLGRYLHQKLIRFSSESQKVLTDAEADGAVQGPFDKNEMEPTGPILT